MRAIFKMCGAMSLGWVLPLTAGSASDISPAAVYDLSPSYLAVGLSVVPVGITNAVQVAADNSGDGGESVKLGGVGLLADGEMAGIEWAVTGSGVLAFDWKVSSEADFDWLRFFEVGGAATNRISGSTGGWSRVFMTINGASDAVHAFRWEYEKDPYGDYVGSDCGWIDAASWSPFYALTVDGGAGDGAYTNGTVVTVTADAPTQYFTFDRWTGDTNTVSDVFASSTAMRMPSGEATVTATYKAILYSLTVGNGSGDGAYTNGASVTITADAPPQYFTFDRWTGNTNGVADVFAPSTALVMLGSATVVTATYKPILYPITVNSGTGSGAYTNGAVVTITADTPPAHYAFDRWTGNTNCISAVLSANTILTVQGTGITITATFKPILYTVEVSGGLGNGSYAYGTQLDLTAAVYEGKRFYRWAGTTNQVADVNAPTTTVFIAGEALSLTSLYSVPLTVNAGMGGGWYPEGSTAAVTADPDPLYKEFAVWTGDATDLLANAYAPATSLTIPTRPATLTATYRDSISRVAGCYGRTFTVAGTTGGVTADVGAASPSGTPALRLGGAGIVPDNGFAAFETAVSGSGTVTFWWRVSSEGSADYLKFIVDGVPVNAISGTKGPWAQVTNRVEGAGTHTLRWEYAKNGSNASSTDAGWVDDIVWTGDAPDPVISPDIHAVAAAGGLFGISFLGERGIPYTVYSNATLSESGWAPMAVVPQEQGETNGVFRFLATVVPNAGQQSCFYRMRGGLEIPSIPSDMVLVQGGSLPDIGNGAITVASFCIGRCEVTWAEWQTVRDWSATNGYDIGSAGAGSATNHPVQWVNWYNCVKWCNARSQMEGRTPVYYTDEGLTLVYKTANVLYPYVNAAADGYRLPTDAEWEFAARGGMKSLGYEYSGGNDLNAVGWYWDNSSDGDKTVGTKASNELGLYDMSGNVWEWCFDWYPGLEGSERVQRGGGWDGDANYCRSAYRGYHSPVDRYSSVGFRAARSLP